MTKNIIYILVAGVAVYFLFFYKKDKTTTPSTPTTPTGGGGTSGGGSTTTTAGPPYAIGETRLKLKNGASSYYIGNAAKDYTNTTGAPVFLGGKVKQRGVENGVAGYILTFVTPQGIEERAFYETDLII